MEVTPLSLRILRGLLLLGGLDPSADRLFDLLSRLVNGLGASVVIGI